MFAKNYQEHVEKVSKRKPSLAHLCQFLSCPSSAHRPCRIASLIITKAGTPTVRNEDISGLASILETYTNESSQFNDDEKSQHTCRDNASTNQAHPQGRILIVEDLSKEIIELLGSSLDVDPLFFAGHLHTPWSDREAQTPHQCTLPSQAQRRNFVNIHYHRIVTVNRTIPPARKLLRSMNIARKLVHLNIDKGQGIGIVQHCTSVLLSKRGSSWIGLILVDRPIDDQYRYTTAKGGPFQQITLSTSLFLGGREDLLDSPSFLKTNLGETEDSFCHGPFDEIPAYWSGESAPCFNGALPNLIGVSYYPLRIVAAEWILYVAVMYRALKQYEYTTAVKGKIHQELEKLDVDMRQLQHWRRRSISSGQKIKAIITVLQAHQSTDSKILTSLLQDYEYLSNSIETFGQRLEGLLPFVASLVQIVDSRRSFGETANISRLTIVALVFVPLAYIASLFSMSQELGPGGSMFWLYFAVAIPVTTAVFLIVRPPSSMLRRLRLRARQARFPRVRGGPFEDDIIANRPNV